MLVPEVQCVIPAIADRAHVLLSDGLELPTFNAWYLFLEPHNSRNSEVTRIGMQLFEVLAIKCANASIVQVPLHFLGLPSWVVL